MATVSPPVENMILEPERIIKAHWRHFLALSILFILPLCFLSSVYHDVFHFFIDASHNNGDQQPRKTVFLLLTSYVVVVTVFHLLAIGSITYSVYQGIHGKPVKLISAVKSSFTSFLPLLATVISSNFIVLGNLHRVRFASFLTTLLIKFILPNLEFDPFLYLSGFILNKLYRRWILVYVIVVVESTWGLTPLERSKNLIKGLRNKILIKKMRFNFRIIFFSFVVTHANFILISIVLASGQINNNNNNGDGELGKRLWTNVLLIVFMSASLTLLTLYNMVSMTVWYIQCRVDHGELVWEKEVEQKEYASLPSDDDGKVPHLVSVADKKVS